MDGTVQNRQIFFPFPCTGKLANDPNYPILSNLIQFYLISLWKRDRNYSIYSHWQTYFILIQFYPISKCKRGSHQFHFLARTNGPHFYTILSSFVHFDPKLFNFIQFHSAKEAGINSISPHGQTCLTSTA